MNRHELRTLGCMKIFSFPPASSLPPSLRQGLWLLLAAVALWSMNLGGATLRDWDEGYYAIVARHMYRSGNWLYPLLHEQPFDKPPLGEWLIAASYSLLGISELTTRLPLALISACGVPLLYWVGQEIFTSQLSAVFSALVYLTLLPIVRHGRLAMHDGITITLFLLLLLGLLKSRQHKLWAIIPGVAFGLLILARGEMAFVLGAIAFLFLVIDRRLSLFKNPYLWIGLFVGILPVIAWYAAQGQHYGAEFWQGRFFGPLVQRIWQPFHNHDGPPWYYLVELLKYSFPWVLFLPSGLILAWQQRHSSWGRLTLVGIVVYGLTISVMRTKLPWYIMPLYPFVALAVGAKLAVVWQHPQPYPSAWKWLFGSAALVGSGSCIYFIVSNQVELLPLGIALTLVFSYTVWLIAKQNRQFIVALFAGVYLILGIFVNSPVWVWELNEAFAVQPVAALLQQHTPKDAAIYTSFAYGRPSLDFYSDRQVKSATSAELQIQWVKKSYLLLDQAPLNSLQLPHSKTLGTAEGFTLIAPSRN